MGSPDSGDIYEGQLRAGDIGLTKEQADQFKKLAIEDRMAELRSQFQKQDAAQAATDSGAVREMPRYKCHKEVWALKIKSIEIKRPTVEELQRILDSNQEIPVFDAAIITPEDEGYAAFGVSDSYLKKHNPQAGGYYVVYKDGYKSYSPAQAFQEGYMRI